MICKWLTKVPEFAHVGKDGGKVHANDTIGYLLDSKADDFVSTTNGCRAVSKRNSYNSSKESLTKGHSLSLEVGISLHDNVSSGIVAFLVPAVMVSNAHLGPELSMAYMASVPSPVTFLIWGELMLGS